MPDNLTPLDPNVLYKWKVIKKTDIDNIESETTNYFRTEDCPSPIQFTITNIEDYQTSIQKQFTIEWSQQNTDLIPVDKYQVFLGFTEDGIINPIFETTDPAILSFQFIGNLDSDYICYVKQINTCGEVDTQLVHFTIEKYDSIPNVSIISPVLDSVVSSSVSLVWTTVRSLYVKVYLGSSNNLADSDLIEDNYTSDSIPLTDLVQDTYYYWKVKQYNDIGSFETQVHYFKVQKYITQPSSVELISPMSNETDVQWSPMFQWDATNQEYYDLYVYKINYSTSCTFSLQQTELIQNITNKYYTLVNKLMYDKHVCIEQDTTRCTHQYKIVQKNNIGVVESEIRNFRLKDCNQQPSIPSLQTPLNEELKVLTTDVTLKWYIVQNQKYYDVYLGEQTDNLVKIAQEITNISEYVVSKTSLIPTKQYYWKIVQTNDCGIQESVVRSFSTASCLDIPGIPTLLNPVDSQTNLQISNIIVRWSTISNADYYQLFIGLNPELSVLDMINVNITDTFYIFQALEKNKTYYWKVCQVNECNISDNSQTFQFSTQTCEVKPSTFRLTTPQNQQTNQQNQVNLNWERQIGQIYYDIYLKKQSFSRFYKVRGNNLSNNYLLRNLEQDQIYEWYVIQNNSCGETKSENTNRFFTNAQLDCLIPIPPLVLEPKNNEINVNPTTVILKFQKSKGKEPITYFIYLDENPIPTTLLVEKQYTKQTIDMYYKYSSTGIEEKVIGPLSFSSYDISNTWELSLYPLIQPRRGYNLSCEKYIYFKQENLLSSGKIYNLKLYNDLTTSYNNNIVMYYSNSQLYNTPQRQSVLTAKMKQLQVTPIQNNITINGSINDFLSRGNNTSDYCILQLKVLPFIGHHSIRDGTLYLQYDEYINESGLNLKQNTRYFWKVVQSNSCGTVESDIWSFTTSTITS